MVVAPPGFSKTFWITQYLRGPQAILLGSGIDIGMESNMTEAGFVGTIRFFDHEPVVVKGAASLYSNAIVGIEEFSALTISMQQQYGQQLDTALLGALDDGWVYKRLAAGEISYQTNITLFTGCQPARFDLSSGLGRRFFFVQFIPSKWDFKLLTAARRQAKGARYNPLRTERIRAALRQLKSQISEIEEVVFDESVYELFDKHNVIHYEEPLYERLLIGYHLMRGDFGKRLYISLDSTARRLCEQEIAWRNQIRRGSEFSEVFLVLREHGGKMLLTELKDRLLQYGLDWSQSSQLIAELQRLKALRVRGEIVELSVTVR